MGVQRAVIVDPYVLRGFPAPLLAPVNVDEVLRDCGQSFDQAGDHRGRMMQKNFNRHDRVIIRGRKRRAGIKIE